MRYRAKSIELTGRSLMHCERCGAWSIYPVPDSEELNALYDEPYWNEERMERRRDELWRKGRSQYRFLARALSQSQRMRLLDIGAGLGPLHQVITTELGERIDYNAVEINPAAVEQLCVRGAQVYSNVKDAGNGFDGIILSQILEHVTQPRPFLEDLFGRLRDGGFLFIEVPNEDCRFKTRDEPHVVYYGPSNLRMLVESMGFRIERLSTCGCPVREMKYHAGLCASPGIRLRWKLMFNHRAPLWLQRSLRWDSHEFEQYGGDRRWIRLLAYKQGSIAGIRKRI